MLVWKILLTNPSIGLAMCACVATMFWCMLILRRRQKGPDSLLAALIGLVSIWQTLRLLRQDGIVLISGSASIDTIADVIVTGVYLVTVLILRISVMERKTTEVHLRLAEANGCPEFRGIPPREPGTQTLPSIILDSNPLAGIAVNQAGLVTHWNAAAERLLGWTAAEVIGRPCPLEPGTPRTKNGDALAVESWAAPMRDAAGRACGSVWMIAPALSGDEENSSGTGRGAASTGKPARLSAGRLAPATGS